MLNRDVFQGRWKQLKGDIQANWEKLTDDDLNRIDGDFEKLAGKLQESYGLSREQVERHLEQMRTSHNA